MDHKNLKRLYLKYLYDLGFSDTDHLNLALYLHDKPFNWTNRMDENRMYDGLGMRRGFRESSTGRRFNFRFDKKDGLDNFDIFSSLDGNACTMLEFFVGFAYRLARDMFSDITCEELVEHMLRNLDIWQFDDDSDFGDDDIIDTIDTILYRWVNCEYYFDGRGGLFPLDHPLEDMRKVQMWTQASWWYDENFT